MEKIKASAIRYRLKGKVQYHIVTGQTHADCVMALQHMCLPVSARDFGAETQGFITDTDRFVDRIEALQIAKEAKQVPDNYDYRALYSDFIDWSK